MSQLNTTNTNVTNLDGRVTNLDGRVTTIYDTGTKYFHANSTGADSQAIGTDSVAIGQGAVSSHDGSIALGASSVADGLTLGSTAYLVGGIASGEVNVGNRRVTGVAAGAQDTDAANVLQLRTAVDSITNIINNSANKWVTGDETGYVAPSAAAGKGGTAIGSNSSSTGNNSVALGRDSNDGGRANVVSVGSAGNERAISNVAAGTANTDAVNVGQLRPFADALGGGTTVNTDGSITGPTYNIQTVTSNGGVVNNTYNNVGDALGGLSTSVVNLNDAVTNIHNGAGIKYFHASTQADASATGAESTAMGPQAVASGESSVAAGDRATASGAGSVAMGQQSNASGTSAVAVGQAQATAPSPSA